MYLQSCTPEQLENIYAESNVSVESLQNDVTHLVEWMKKQPHLPNIRDEEWLSKFLIGCKNSLSRTKTKLEEYYKIRALFPSLLTNRDPCSTEMKKMLNTMTYVVLPKLTPEGNRIMVWKIFDAKRAEELTTDQFVKLIYFHTDFLLKVDTCARIVQIFDLEYVTLNFAVMMVAAVRQISLISKAVGVLRADKVVVLHVNAVLEPVLNTMKLLLPNKLTKRIIFRSSNADLSDILSKDLLPSDYGGSGKLLRQYFEEYLKYTEQLSWWFNEEDSVKADLSKIPNQNYVTHHHLFGVDGSFRKLSLD